MKKLLCYIFILIGATFFIAGNFTDLRTYRDFPIDKLRTERDVYKNQLDGLKNAEDYESVDKRKEIKRDIVKIDAEIGLKRYRIDLIAIVLALVGIFGLFAMKFKILFQGRSRSMDAVIEDFEIEEESPKEFYVDEWEFNQRIEGGFKTKKEAVEWVKSDPLLKCDYCGARLRSTMTGRKEGVQLVTFYKKVPEGAKDLRVVLGSFWFANPATELKCPGCARMIKR